MLFLFLVLSAFSNSSCLSPSDIWDCSNVQKKLRIDCLKVALSGELLLLSARLARALVSLLLLQFN